MAVICFVYILASTVLFLAIDRLDGGFRPDNFQVLLNDTRSPRTKMLDLASRPLQDQKIALVIPYIDSDIDHLVEKIQGWHDIGDACSLSRQGQMGLFFYNNLVEIPGKPRVEPLIEKLVQSTSVLGCFVEFRTLYADLKPHEDGYPEGPSVMFFKLLLDERLRDGELAGYSHVMWMEWDTRPLRPLWLDAIVNTAAQGGSDSFWIRGSHYYGKGLDGAVLYEENRGWVGHINGNALYHLRDQDFHTFLRLVMEREPPTDYWRPFDIAIWKVLNDFPYSWRIYQEYGHNFQYSEFIRHTSFFGGNNEDILDDHPDLYLMHGDKESAGNENYFRKFKDGLPTTNKTVYGYEIRQEVQLSVLVRSFSSNLEFAAAALESAKRFIPYALEYVAVVPEADLSMAEKLLPSYVTIHGEPHVLESQAMQQKYTKMNADKYCKGRFILHLDSDVVFYRTVNYKDLFFFGKPFLDFDSYDNLVAIKHVDKWRKGISYIMDGPVDFEYSRSNQHVYPRDVYAPAREYLERRFNTSLVEFLKTRKGSLVDLLRFHEWTVAPEDLDKTSLFSDFNYMGAFLHRDMPDRVAWHFLGPDGTSPFPEDAFNQVIRPAFACQGNARSTDSAHDIHEEARKHYHPEKKAEQLRFLQDIASGKTQHCYELIWFLSTLAPKS